MCSAPYSARSEAIMGPLVKDKGDKVWLAWTRHVELLRFTLRHVYRLDTDPQELVRLKNQALDAFNAVPSWGESYKKPKLHMPDHLAAVSLATFAPTVNPNPGTSLIECSSHVAHQSQRRNSKSSVPSEHTGVCLLKASFLSSRRCSSQAIIGKVRRRRSHALGRRRLLCITVILRESLGLRMKLCRVEISSTTLRSSPHIRPSSRPSCQAATVL